MSWVNRYAKIIYCGCNEIAIFDDSFCFITFIQQLIEKNSKLKRKIVSVLKSENIKATVVFIYRRFIVTANTEDIAPNKRRNVDSSLEMQWRY